MKPFENRFLVFTLLLLFLLPIIAVAPAARADTYKTVYPYLNYSRYSWWQWQWTLGMGFSYTYDVNKNAITSWSPQWASFSSCCYNGIWPKYGWTINSWGINWVHQPFNVQEYGSFTITWCTAFDNHGNCYQWAHEQVYCVITAAAGGHWGGSCSG